jgi:hypothetical protein
LLTPDIHWLGGIRTSSEVNEEKGGKMKVSIEAKVAAAVAAAFIALTLGAIAQGNGRNQTGELNSYDLADNPRINTYISQDEIQ